MENQKLLRRPSVVLVPFPFQGHLSPMLQLGTALHSKGFSIIVAHTIYNSPNPSNHPDFTFLPIIDNLPDHPDTSIEKRLALVKTINANCEEPLRDRLAQIMKHRDTEDRVLCIIYDTIMYCSEAVADHLKLQCLNFRTVAASVALLYDSLPMLAAEGHIPHPDSKLEDVVPGFPDLRFKDISTSDLGSSKDVLDDRIFTNISSKYSANIWNTLDHLEQTALAQFQHRYPVPSFSIGPLHMIAPSSSTSLREADTNCISWLNKQAPRTVIYVSIGSLAVMEKKVIHEMAWGLANSKQPFLWVIRTDSASESEWKLLPDEFSQTIGERGCIVKWAPQSEVLAHNAVGGFWSHCGWNSTLESLSQGVPMICQPFNADQYINARYLSHVWKLGLQFENALEKKQIKQAILRLMVDEEGKEMRQNAIKMKEQIRLSVSKGGHSYNSMNDLAALILSFQITN